MRDFIENWMRRVIDTQRYREFDDLHVDQIDGLFKAQDQWLSGAVQCLKEALSIRDEHHWHFTVAAGISLVSHEKRAGVNFSTLNDAQDELGWSPPSLYLFEPGAEPWSDSEDCREMKRLAENFSPNLRSFFCEWYDENDKDFRRSLWIAG